MVGWHHRLNGHELEQTEETVKDREAWCAAAHGLQRVGHDLSSSAGKGYPLQYSGLENSMDSIVNGVAKSRTQLKQMSTRQQKWGSRQLQRHFPPQKHQKVKQKL